MRGAHRALRVGHWGGLTRDEHNQWPDTGEFIFFKSRHNRQVWLIYHYMFKFQKEITIIDSIKLPSVSIKFAHIGPFTDRFLNSLKPGDILKIIHSNLFSSSMYVVTCIERSHKGAYWGEVNIGSGNGLVPSNNKPLPGPLLNRFMTPYGVTMPQMSSVYILHCRHQTCWWPGTFSTLDISRHGTRQIDHE